MSNESTNPQLSFYPRSDWLAGFLRSDRIRLDTLVSLVAGWADPDARDEVIATLDALAEVVSSPRAAEGELDAAVEAVEAAAGMDMAQVPLDKAAAVRLHAELSDVAVKLCRFEPGRTASVPRQQDRRTG